MEIFSPCNIVGVGLNHEVVSKSAGFVRKIPTAHNKLTLEKARISAEFYSKYFPEYVPPTKIVGGSEEVGAYVAIQKRIYGEVLVNTSPDELSNDTLFMLLQFINKVGIILKEERIQTDVVGRLQDDYSPSVQLMKKLPYPLRDLYVFYRLRNFFQSSNIIITKEGKPIFIDTVGLIVNKKGELMRRTSLEVAYWYSLYHIYRKSIEDILEKRA